MKHLHFDVCGGASGDMILSSLLDLGMDAGELAAIINNFKPALDFSLSIEKTAVKGFAGTICRVILPDEDAHSSHVLADGGDDEPPASEHSHAHTDRHNHVSHGGHTRGASFTEIKNAIRSAHMPKPAETKALQTFEILARAEAAVHGKSLDDVHFHEVGAVDSIIDVCAVCAAIYLLNFNRVTCSPLPAARGFAKSAHGLIPVPAPATLEILKGVPLFGTDAEGELVTPTAAALLKAHASEFVSFPSGSLSGVGVGLGHKSFDGRHNLMRALSFEEPNPQIETNDEVVEFSAVLDDAAPAFVASCARRLLDEGALDAWISPIIMKKGRPGLELTALCRNEDAQKISGVIFSETATLGMRVKKVGRIVLKRGFDEVDTPYGKVRRKLRYLPSAIEPEAFPELDDCERLGLASGVPANEVYVTAKSAGKK